MPIQCSLTIPPLSDAAFAEIDHAVMACAYASQNSLGRLYDERVYENDMAARLRAWQSGAQRPILLDFGDFGLRTGNC